MTPNTRPPTGTLQKLMPTLTRTATQLNRRAVIAKPKNAPHMRYLTLFFLLLISFQAFGQSSELAIINDHDGYTNFRIDKGANYNIKGKFLNGDLFITVPSSDDWWLVVSYENKQGYMHKSKITLIK